MRQSREGNDKKYKVRLVTETFAHIAVGIISIASVFISLTIPKGCRALKVGWVFFFFFEICGFGPGLRLCLHITPLFLDMKGCWDAPLALFVIYEPSASGTEPTVTQCWMLLSTTC